MINQAINKGIPVVNLIGGAVFPVLMISVTGNRIQAATNELHTADLKLVDCLSPARIRRLGGGMTLLSPGRLIKTTAVDCRIRGGRYGF